jgi:hypothetical protein
MFQFHATELNGWHGIGKWLKNDDTRLHQFRGGATSEMVTLPTHFFARVAIGTSKI